ncbi:methyltransferase [Streptomyces sp. NPDC127069]|uniref:methyltransferase n=1 Tax=Streptomyces sp. NPDC127069 TaxID=3347128 RepID=UPI003647462B
MARLSKEAAKAHEKATALVALDRDLTETEKDFVLDNWQEAASATHNLAGAFFTPEELARDLSIEVHGDRIIDLCAGIGRLAYSCRDHWGRRWNNQRPREIVCVEQNPDYVAVGRKILPEATWICADVLTVPTLGLGRFDTAISNPPFGAIRRSGNAGAYTGPKFEYHVIAIASQIAEFGAFIIPQRSAPFRYSGEHYYREERDRDCSRFIEQTGIAMGPGAGFDTAIYRDRWRGVSPRVEVVCCDFEETAPAAVPQPVPRPPALAVVAPSRPVIDMPLPDPGDEQLAFDLGAAS